MLGRAVPDLPIYTREQVAEHNTKDKRVWVTFREGVFDVTDFISIHPGGMKRIMLAAGGDVAYPSVYTTFNG
mgnify:CR=1 FL=1